MKVVWVMFSDCIIGKVLLLHNYSRKNDLGNGDMQQISQLSFHFPFILRSTIVALVRMLDLR